MQQLLGDRAGTLDSTFLKEQRLPPNIRMVLTAPAASMLEELAKLADRVAEVAIPVIAAVTPTPRTNEVEQLRVEVAKLQASLQSLTREGQSSTLSRGRRLCSPGPPHQQPNNDTVCWYHKRFGDAATKCCSMAQQENYLASH